jgi:hypothetical protein
MARRRRSRLSTSATIRHGMGGRRTLKTLTSVGRLMDHTCAPDP